MSYKETVEETVPLSSEISLNPEENYNRCLWKRLRERNEGLSITWGCSLYLHSIVVVISSIIYFFHKDEVNYVSTENIRNIGFRDGFASFTIFTVSILAFVCFIVIYAYFNPIVVEIEMDSIPMEELPRKDDGRE
ncbi:uncharacterized protein SOCG_02339 [Schizosaccharomyces octosporus yFS286]|uniref:Uncharacterized protein n=1 Tax=Schizosaccharomyces octosporus (strain yFS286) TaxID=483514 RepID=S9Q5E1_SCHOY|nr:uncharacterized protein SOCG_02339 [Schizosaccharomyces octosporus yFS286]EPX74858.1 hypothetical protein SOCG_02339 [Schizosaccharomyces octosporus yFS286]